MYVIKWASRASIALRRQYTLNFWRIVFFEKKKKKLLILICGWKVTRHSGGKYFTWQICFCSAYSNPHESTPLVTTIWIARSKFGHRPRVQLSLAHDSVLFNGRWTRRWQKSTQLPPFLFSYMCSFAPKVIIIICWCWEKFSGVLVIYIYYCVSWAITSVFWGN